MGNPREMGFMYSWWIEVARQDLEDISNKSNFQFKLLEAVILVSYQHFEGKEINELYVSLDQGVNPLKT